jgi:hypothetical protein
MHWGDVAFNVIVKFDMRPDVILFITHFWDGACTAQIMKLRREVGQLYDIRVAGYIPDGMPRPAVPDDVSVHFYGERDLNLVLPERGPGEWSHHFILPRFVLDFPEYAHYWMIEYDVRYTGDWGTLLASLNDPGVAYYGIALQRRASHPQWSHWGTLSTGRDEVTSAHVVKSFAPLQRLSRPAVSVVQTALGNGWRGHYEALWPTAIAHAGLKLEDIGGDGEFTPDSRRGQNYTCTLLDRNGSPGSFVYRPSFEENEVTQWPPTLWHPVKPAGMQEPRMPDLPTQARPPSLARRILRRVSDRLNSR